MDKQDTWASSSQGERQAPIPLVGIIYKLANGEQISLDVSIEVKELLEQFDRQIRSQRRQDRRHLDFVESTDELSTRNVPPHEDIASLIIRMGDCKWLYTAINKLPTVQRRRLCLYFFEKLTYRQIANMEDVRFKTVARSVDRALDSLRKLYAK